MKKRMMLVAGLALVACLVSSCGKDQSPNILPDTTLLSPPSPQQGSTHSYLVEMAWRGEDPDGRVVAYEVAWHDGMTYTGTLDSLVWGRVTVEDSTFVVSADSCPAEGNTCSGNHTFFVRAIDDNGGKDPTPATVSFHTTTTIPHAVVNYPPRDPADISVTLPTCVKIGWTGSDQDGHVVQYRYVFKPYEELPTHQPPPQWDHRWSPWSSATEVVTSLMPLGSDNPWSFYVQARDDAGATETVFQDKRNHILIYIDENLDSHPSVSICANHGACNAGGVSLGCRSTANPSQMEVPINVNIGDTLCFRASFAPGSFATKVASIAFAVNDPGEPASWSDATVTANAVYPPGGVYIATANLNYVYVWVKDDYCEYGSTAMAYIIVNGR